MKELISVNPWNQLSTQYVSQKDIFGQISKKIEEIYVLQQTIKTEIKALTGPTMPKLLK